MLNSLPIGRKLALIIFLSNVILLTAVFAVTGLWNVNTIRASSIKTAESAVQVFSQDFTKIIVYDSANIAADTVSRLKAIELIKNVVLFNASGKPVFFYYDSEESKMSPPVALPPQTFFKNGYLHVYADVIYEGSKHGIVYYRISTDLLDSTLSNYVISLSAFVVLIVIVSILIAFKFQRIISAPIIELANVANYVLKNNDLSKRAQTEEKNEIGQLYDDFNLMIEGISRQKETLEAKNKELEQHRNQLEILVSERTREITEYVKELETFSYSVSHDLRAPLRTINGFGSILIDNYADKLDDDGQNLLIRMIAACNRMGELIDDLLLLSRVNQCQINKEMINISEIANDVLEDQLSVNNENKEIDINVQSEIGVFADKKLMRVVFDNLLINALKYKSNTEKLSLEIGSEVHDDSTVVYVRDNGIGFDMKYHDKLFMPFQRLVTSEEYEGTGIGLATVKRILQRHNGDIWAKSETSRGSTFYLRLPNQSALI